MCDAAYTIPMADLQRKYYDPCIRVHIAEHATQVTGLLEMLAVLPVLWSFMALEDSRFAAFAAFVALEALQSRQDRWDAMLQMCARDSSSNFLGAFCFYVRYRV